MILSMLAGCTRIVEPLRVTESRMGTHVSITIGQTGYRVPTEEEVRSELELVDYRKIRLFDDRIELGEGQRITLGGIAKGYAVDLATEALRASGISSAIVEAGGDLRVIGRKNIDTEWHIAIQHPRDEGEYITRLTVPDMAVVTSGDYQRYYDGDREYHHIINPDIGLLPLRGPHIV